MNPCDRAQSLFVEAFYQELAPADQQWFEDHLKSCETCASKFQEMSRVLKLMSRRERPDPGEEFWNNYRDRLQQRMSQKRAVKTSPQTWIYRIAAAIAFLSIGLIIGRMYFGPRTVSIATKKTPAVQEPANADLRAVHFLERSQVLLIGIVNMDPTAASPEDLSRQRQISQDLVREASTLKGELKDPRQRKLQQLVSELQIILLQISNLEATEHLQGVELVKSGVDRKGILLKIDLEQMRMADQRSRQASKPTL